MEAQGGRVENARQSRSARVEVLNVPRCIQPAARLPLIASMLSKDSKAIESDDGKIAKLYVLQGLCLAKLSQVQQEQQWWLKLGCWELL